MRFSRSTIVAATLTVASLGVVGCQSTGEYLGVSSFFPSFGGAEPAAAEFPSPDESLQSAPPAVDGDWDAPA